MPPATEKTWRDQKLMHVIFGVSALLMLISTVWMIAKDHNREWRQWQLADRGKERWALAARLEEQEALSQSRLEALNAEMQSVRSQRVAAAAIQQFKDVVQAEDERLQAAGTPAEPQSFARLDQAAADLEAADRQAAVAARNRLLAAIDVFIREARRRETQLSSDNRFARADRDAKVSEVGIAIEESRSQATIDRLQDEADEIKERVAQTAADLAAATDYRTSLEEVRRDITADATEIQRQLDSVHSDLSRLGEALADNTTNPLEWVTRLPVLDALYDGNIRIQQIWLPEMTINYNFSHVARFDRCTSCHRSIDQTQPGSAVQPAYPAIPPGERNQTLVLQTPDSRPETVPDAGGQAVPATLESVYGFTLAPQGQIERHDVTVHYVLPETPAAVAGLEMGDVIREINGTTMYDEQAVEDLLLRAAPWGEPVEIGIRRGLPQPFTSHPRLDLFVGSLSPHKKEDMGCTICHDGQGSGTEFPWTSHTPNNPEQAIEWSREHGWFDNHFWTFPMKPARFAESNCLKCHHEVVELRPSERFPEPPAPKLMRGYDLIVEYGCFGCHEVNGFDGPDKRIGPDLRLEPNYTEVAAEALRDTGLNDQERAWAQAVIADPTNSTARHDLLQAIEADERLSQLVSPGSGAMPLAQPADEAAAQPPEQPRLTSETHSLSSLLTDVETPGEFRKRGPSLRHLSSKVEFDWLYDWIRMPSNFRPSTRMPQFFHQWRQLVIPQDALRGAEAIVGDPALLDGDVASAGGNEIRTLARQILEASGDAPLELRMQLRELVLADAESPEPLLSSESHDAAALLVDDAERFEPVETRALAQFLLAESSPFEYVPRAPGVTEEPSVERGKLAFQMRGCLACHSHREFPGIESTHGPDLSDVGAKFDSESGLEWLYSWLRDPQKYHPRTVMPNLYLEPVTDAEGGVSDPAADIAAYLLSVPSEWQPESPSADISPEEIQAIEDLALVWLSGTLPQSRAERYLNEGVPAEQAALMKTDESVLGGMTEENRTDKLLEYIARRSISRYGCFGCHDIPGYEAAKPIGTALADWGRKKTSTLAFENIHPFLATHGLGEANQAGAAAEHPTEVHEFHEGGGHGLNPLDYGDDVGFYLQSLNSHQRDGFIWQKLREPRSYDYEKTENKRYDERLRMPAFPFDDAEREAVITFVLGLVNEPPAARYIFQPSPRQEAIVQGRKVLDRFNCAGCHVLDMERWDIAYLPDSFPEPTTTADEFPFLRPNVTPDRRSDSLETDRRGLRHATLHGMVVRNEQTGAPQVVDAGGFQFDPSDEEQQPHYDFTLYDQAVLSGHVHQVGGEALRIPAERGEFGPRNGTAYPALGGDLAFYLYPHVIAQELVRNPAARASEAWGWLPPPLVGEGRKVQTEWLHDFLMDPRPIRPAVVMRMPNFHMSSDEASKLVNYFAAKDGADYPYEYSRRRRESYLAELEAQHPGRLGDAMSIVLDRNYCVQCHAVADFQPEGAIKTQGPQLAEVYQRLRPEFVRRYVAKPQQILPYTGMPVNIQYRPNEPNLGGVNQELYPGTSVEQLDGVVDLLMNFDLFTKERTLIAPLVPPPPAEEGAAAAAATEVPELDQAAGG